MTQTDINAAFSASLVDRPPQTERPKKVFNPYRNERRICITLERSDKIPPTGQFFGYGAEVEVDDKGTKHMVSRDFILRPGEKAWVPEGLTNVLNDAIESVPILGGDGTLVVGYEDRLRFPYRIHTNEPIPAEFAEVNAELEREAA